MAKKARKLCAKSQSTCKKSTMVRMAQSMGDAWLNMHVRKYLSQAALDRMPLSQRTKKNKANILGRHLSRRGLGHKLGLYGIASSRKK